MKAKELKEMQFKAREEIDKKIATDAVSYFPTLMAKIVEEAKKNPFTSYYVLKDDCPRVYDKYLVRYFRENGYKFNIQNRRISWGR